MEFKHTSVLLTESIEGLKIKPEGIYVDGTLGGAGHASVVAAKLSGKGRLIGIDQDEAAIEAATLRLAPYKEHVTIVRDNYRNTAGVLKDLSVPGIDGMLLDLGVSSYQLDNEERGFSYRFDTPLDMRMDQRSNFSAKEIVNEYSEMELFRVIRDYGEDKFAKNIAKHIVAARKERPIEVKPTKASSMIINNTTSFFCILTVNRFPFLCPAKFLPLHFIRNRLIRKFTGLSDIIAALTVKGNDLSFYGIPHAKLLNGDPLHFF